MSRTSFRTAKNVFLTFAVAFWWYSYSDAIKLQGVADILHNFEAIDPDVLNVFAFRDKPAYRHPKSDSTEFDIMDLDTSDILNCFSSLSYTCFQKKIIFYLDSLNRVEKINLFGGYMSFVKVTPGVSTPITEQLLASRHVTDETSLGGLLKEIFEDFVDSHILRITVPVINARLDARNARGHCYDFSLGDAKISNDTKDTQSKGRDPTCYRGDQSMVALSSALVMKMLMLLPTLLKVIAAKAIFGLVMGVMSVILSKMAILPILLSYAKKNQPNLGPGGSYRQGMTPTFTLTTDNYGHFYQQEEQPGRITTAGTLIDNHIGSPDYATSSPIGDNIWAETKFANTKNYHVANNDLKYVPRKDPYRSMHRRAISKGRRSYGYPEMKINGRNAADTMRTLTTTAGTSTEASEKRVDTDEQPSSVEVRAKRWLGHVPIYIAERTF